MSVSLFDYSFPWSCLNFRFFIFFFWNYKITKLTPMHFGDTHMHWFCVSFSLQTKKKRDEDIKKKFQKTHIQFEVEQFTWKINCGLVDGCHLKPGRRFRFLFFFGFVLDYLSALCNYERERERESSEKNQMIKRTRASVVWFRPKLDGNWTVHTTDSLYKLPNRTAVCVRERERATTPIVSLSLSPGNMFTIRIPHTHTHIRVQL